MKKEATGFISKTFDINSGTEEDELRKIKDLRNRIHLQTSQGISDADYAVFESIELFNEVKKIVFLFMQKCLKISTEEMNDIFYFLLPFEDFVHSKRE